MGRRESIDGVGGVSSKLVPLNWLAIPQIWEKKAASLTLFFLGEVIDISTHCKQVSLSALGVTHVNPSLRWYIKGTISTIFLGLSSHPATRT